VLLCDTNASNVTLDHPFCRLPNEKITTTAPSVIARSGTTKQSSDAMRDDGLLRYARNDGGGLVALVGAADNGGSYVAGTAVWHAAIRGVRCHTGVIARSGTTKQSRDAAVCGGIR
jgi:hypothetical protein